MPLQPADATLNRESAFVDSVEFLSGEPQTSRDQPPALLFKGNLPTPCNVLRLAFQPLTPDQHLKVSVYSLVKPGEVCLQVL